ncbi:cellulase family glycosylhydrolase [Xanthomonas rydalmerensis]|uniref:Endoglucanase n=2 Tax=Xanthomonas rydalmerensis TaxID=3046274 RepID=A0ABZ0JMT9_9XANT|nr:cellulase family glycosylhydrolase [Xanthomonas sp. DM-2023]WOS40477.1 cellulase family glycosylhydrolase [Xanthomonas sp. DM-2023]WOS44661.1 cellulase family glycosylhydrolase [Xanthomonas sp. DM-2023]WOS48841.1 cellulase family glycosylhydrolase [Xanthomonas sp. DM-2023]WOS53021.1 cellulase family glycosylhydrolase [Xanthomonas sp. DM-2023]WOS57205.1 cellulase family glycosylhydrolase [Xanthomonas sp. DM-2023]
MSMSPLTRITRCVLAAALLAASGSAWSYAISKGTVVDDRGNAVQLRGVNWFGFEGSAHTVHGLWARNWKDMITQMQGLGFNAVRLPFCPQTLRGVAPTSIDYGRNPDLQGLSSLQVLDKVINELSSRGMYVLLDHHSPDCQGISELWYTDSYSEQQWLSDLSFVAKRYASVPGVIGIDLKNEPNGRNTWGTGNLKTDWNKAVERASAAVLKVAPKWLIVVEGITDNPTCSSSNGYWWGGNLEPLTCTKLNVPANRLLLSPHVYGPDVNWQPYFGDGSFPANMPAIWERQFGQLTQRGYAMMIGEFGGNEGRNQAQDPILQKALIDYLIKKNIRSGFYWAWNPNSRDTGGVLDDDWTTVRTEKMAGLKRLWGDTGGTTPTPTPTPTPNPEPTPTPTPAPGSASFSTKVIVDSDWNAGYCERVQVTNSGSATGNWAVTLSISGTINNLWNATWTQSGTTLSASGVDWNKTLAAGATAEFGFCAAR